MSNSYSKRRKEGFLYAFDSSTTKIGKQSIKTGLDQPSGGLSRLGATQE